MALVFGAVFKMNSETDRRQLVAEGGALCPMSARAFTLVELLTVLAIIGALAAVVIPLAGEVQKRVKSAVTLSNLRQMVIGAQSQAAEYGGAYILYGTGGTAWLQGNSTLKDSFGVEVSLLQYLYPGKYPSDGAGGGGVYPSPDGKNPLDRTVFHTPFLGRATDPGENGTANVRVFGLNNQLAGKHMRGKYKRPFGPISDDIENFATGRRLGDCPRPSETFLLAETVGVTGISEKSAINFYRYKTGWSHMAFVDGSVRLVHADDVPPETGWSYFWFGVDSVP